MIFKMEETEESRPDLVHHRLQQPFGASPSSVPQPQPSPSNRLDLSHFKASEIPQNFMSTENKKRPAGIPFLHPIIPPASPYLLPSPYLQIPVNRPLLSADVFLEDRNGSSHLSSAIFRREMDAVKTKRRYKKRRMEKDKLEIPKSNGGDKATMIRQSVEAVVGLRESAKLEIPKANGGDTVPMIGRSIENDKLGIQKSNGGDKPTIIGQSVEGIIDGVFDSGYLISVRIGESDFNFRGVVFGPDLMVPVSENNDVAPAAMQVERYPTDCRGSDSGEKIW